MDSKIPLFSVRALRPVYHRTSLHNGVIDEVEDPELRAAYAYCRKIIHTSAKTFYLAARFLPYEKQRSIFAIYALCRYLDNLVDEQEEEAPESGNRVEQIAELLSEWEHNVQRTYKGEQLTHPVLYAFSDVLKRYQIPVDLPLQLIEGMSMDLVRNRYETFDELYDYAYKVASVVGLMVCEVFGYEDDTARKHAVDLGIAMQLTNILRDVGEDLQRDRIYLPAEELETYNITESDLKNQRVSREFVSLMKFQIERARAYYRSSDNGIAMLNGDSRMPVYLARYNYARILDRIEETQYQVFTYRAHLTFTQKLSILPKAWWQTRFSRPRKSFKNSV